MKGVGGLRRTAIELQGATLHGIVGNYPGGGIQMGERSKKREGGSVYRSAEWGEGMLETGSREKRTSGDEKGGDVGHEEWQHGE